MPSYRDLPERMMRGEVSHPPIAELTGFRLTHVETGKAIVELQAETRHANPMGTVQGGILCVIADAAMGMAFATTVEEGETFTTLELKINYLKPVRNAQLKAVGAVVKRGKTIGLTECDVFDEQASLVAHAISTVMVLRGEMAEGR